MFNNKVLKIALLVISIVIMAIAFFSDTPNILYTVITILYVTHLIND